MPHMPFIMHSVRMTAQENDATVRGKHMLSCMVSTFRYKTEHSYRKKSIPTCLKTTLENLGATT